jgi:hypothetical protein
LIRRKYFLKKVRDLFPTLAPILKSQKVLENWLYEYNYERPHLGYRNQGRRPWETIEMFLNGMLKL